MYSREIDGKVLTLAPTGWTYKSTFVLYDRETETLWYPDKKGLIGIQGTFFKRRLPYVQSKDTLWSDWEAEHPSSKLMK